MGTRTQVLVTFRHQFWDWDTGCIEDCTLVGTIFDTTYVSFTKLHLGCFQLGTIFGS